MSAGIITRSGIVLGLFAMATSALIAWTEYSTAEQRAENVNFAQQKIIAALVPRDQHDNDPLQDTVPIAPGGPLANEDPAVAYIARKGGEIIAVVLPVTAPDGYSGRIQLMVGVRPDNTLIGARTLAHRETPGLGDKVDLRKSDWMLGFAGKSLQNPRPADWKVKKDGGAFDQFTGATITPRAVVAAVYRTLKFFEQERDRFLAPAQKDEKDAVAGGPEGSAG